jgi:hypothetical protein
LWSIIWDPRDEGDLVPSSLAALELVFNVEDSVAAAHALLALPVFALCVEKLFAEYAVVAVGRGLFNNDLFPIVANLEDDPFRRLAATYGKTLVSGPSEDNARIGTMLTV